jgi:hypothetical protein
MRSQMINALKTTCFETIQKGKYPTYSETEYKVLSLDYFHKTNTNFIIQLMFYHKTAKEAIQTRHPL